VKNKYEKGIFNHYVFCFLRKKSLAFQKFENHVAIFLIGFGLVEKNMGNEGSTYKKFK
jgi:hypothetical protein